MQDLIAIIREIIRLNNTQDPVDDIDSLANRRVKLVGELVQRQFRLGMLRLQRNILDRMSMSDPATVTPSQLVNSRPVVAAVKEFFSSSQLSQLMDETNPFSELSHKRRLSSMGPGGLTRERAGFEVRDTHPTHYGRICTVETPEGGNVGLVLNLATYARINEYGFIEAPYRVVKNGKVTDEIVYVDAAAEENMVIADTSAKLDENGKFVDEYVSARKALQPTQVMASEVTHMDAAHKEILGVAASMIPFVEKNRVDRSLMACAMQKQAVPLVKPEAIDEKGVLLSLEVDPEDVGRIIGKRGATAQSIRTLLRALGTKNDARYNLKIVNNDDYQPKAKTEEKAAVAADDSFASEDDDATEADDTDIELADDDTTVEEGSELAKKTRAELADLDDLDI